MLGSRTIVVRYATHRLAMQRLLILLCASACSLGAFRTIAECTPPPLVARFVRSQGIDAETLAQALKHNASHSTLAEMKLPGMDAGNFEPHFSLKNMFKDAQFALDLANDAGIELPALSTTASVLFNTIRKGHGEEDYSVVFSNYDDVPKTAPE